MKHALIAVLFASSVIIIAYSQNTLDHMTRAEPQVFLLPPQQLHLFSFGYRENMADSLWIRVIQDFDYCEKGKAKPGETAVVADAVHAPQAREGRCKNGWVYHMIDAITELAPRFRQPFASGAVLLSILVDDIEGATHIFEKGLKQFPTDWPIQYNAAYHYLYERGDRQRAAELLISAGKNGAPQWVYSLAANLYTKTGQALLAKSVLEDLLAKDPEGRFTPRIKQRLEEVERALREDSQPSQQQSQSQ